MIDPAVLDALLASGATAEMIVAAVKADRAVDAAREAREREEYEARMERKREGNAERQRRHRERNAVSRVTAVSNGDERDAGPFPSPSSSPDPSNNPTHTPGNTPRARKGTRISQSWQPEPLTGTDATMVSTWPPGTLDREMAKFRDFWAAKAGAGGSKLDWQATWRNWLRSADERIPRNGTGQRHQPSGQQSLTGFGRTADAAARFAARG